MTAHREQTAHIIRDAVQRVLTRGLNDPRVRGLVSITEVEVSPDLGTAMIGVSVLPEQYTKSTLNGLTSASPHIRWQIARDVKLRRLPKLEFKIDESLKREARVLAAINAARDRDRREVRNQPGTESEDPES